MIVYQTDAAGLLVGQTTADEDPFAPGTYLIPGGCVEAAPPDAIAGHVPRWAGNAWEQVPDQRGEIWYRGTELVTIVDLGDPALLGLSSTAPAPTVADLRLTKLASIIAAADALLGAGAPVSDGLHIALDDGSRADLTAMAATATAAASGAVTWPASYSRGWISIENVRIPLATPAAGLVLAAVVGDWYARVVQHRRDLKDQVLAAVDEAALDAIDSIAGWPA